MEDRKHFKDIIKEFRDEFLECKDDCEVCKEFDVAREDDTTESPCPEGCWCHDDELESPDFENGWDEGYDVAARDELIQLDRNRKAILAMLANGTLTLFTLELMRKAVTSDMDLFTLRQLLDKYLSNTLLEADID